MLPDLFDLPRPPRPRAALPWTEERLRHLRRRWKQGARAREIGAELGVSANAVIAKIHRLGIARLSPYGGAPGRRQKLQNIPRAARPQYVRRRAFSLHRVRPAPPLLKAKRYLEYARLDAQIGLHDPACPAPLAPCAERRQLPMARGRSGLAVLLLLRRAGFAQQAVLRRALRARLSAAAAAAAAR